MSASSSDPGAKRSVPKSVRIAVVLTAAAGVLLLAGPLGYASGVMGLGTSLLGLFLVGFVLAAAALVTALFGLIVAWRRPAHLRRGTGRAALAAVIALVLLAFPVRFLIDPKPAIHDITTDTVDPPLFVAVLPLRADAPNPTVYGGDAIASQQRAAYPDLQPLLVSEPPLKAYERALAAVRTMGWELVAEDAAAGRIEATDTTFWFRFKDDVVVRVRPEGTGSRIDVRSLSRVGGGDVGTNAARIKAYLDALKAAG